MLVSSLQRHTGQRQAQYIYNKQKLVAVVVVVVVVAVLMVVPLRHHRV